MTRINKQFKIKKAEKINEYYDPSKALPDRYTISNGQFSLYQMDILCGFSDSDHPEDTFWLSENRKFLPVLFWAKKNQELNIVFKEISKRYIDFVELIIENSKQKDFKHLKKVIKEPNKYIDLCELWIKSINPNAIQLNCTITEAQEFINDAQYKFRKICELFNNMSAFCGLEKLYIDFKKSYNINTF